MQHARRRLAVAALAAAAALTLAAPVDATPKHKPAVDVGGQGTYVLTGPGSAVISGTAEGTPVDGPYRAVLTAADGTLPQAGVCEPGTGVVRIEDKKKVLELRADGDVCGTFVNPPTSIVTHVFTGTYEVVDAPRKQLVGTDGFLELRLATNGVASMTALDT